MSKFSAPINPERPRGGPSCNKCARLSTIGRVSCTVGGEIAAGSCELFTDASVERTERRGLKAGYDVARVA